MSINVGSNGNCPSFKGNLVLVNEKNEKVLLPAEQVKAICEKNSGLGKGVYLYSNHDALGSFYRIKNIPYQEVVDLYKAAKNSENDVEIKLE